jgi:FHS family L-fucose permease-like MFS transporter
LAVQFAFFSGYFLFSLPWARFVNRIGTGEKIDDSIWKHPNLVLGAVGTFAYVGAEVSIGSFLVNYFSLPEIAGVTAKTAAGFVSFYWGGAMIDVFLGLRFSSVTSRGICLHFAPLLQQRWLRRP